MIYDRSFFDMMGIDMQSTTGAALPAAFRHMAWSNFFAQFSEQIALAAAPLAAVLLLSAGPAETGWLQTAQTLPFLLLSIPAGLLVDHASRRTLMVGSEALRAVSLAAILGLIASGLLNLPLLASLGFLGAIGTVCYNVAAPAMIPSIVPGAQLGNANRWLELARSAAYAGGPAIGGAVVGWTGAPAAYVLATILSILAVMLLRGLPNSRLPGRKGARGPLYELKEAVAFVTNHDLLRPIMITAIFFNTAWFVLQAIYVAYAVQHLGLSPVEVGVTLGIYGGGMLTGALLAPVVARRLSFGMVIVIGPLCGFSAALVMLLTIWMPGGFLPAISFVLFGAGPILWSIATTTLRQTVTPHAMLGRVSALIMTVTFGARPIGAALGALVATRSGAEACLWVATGGFLIQLLTICGSRVPKLKKLPVAS
ncbi:MAG: MFS transporter [Paracoccus sp. (in: a-proteobacteria)]|uniref:MFS transporter n=1 Tax=Paracoccus sp. TaxID=267 RepID=UPI0039E4B28E